RSHTATHMLHKVLHEFLGEQATQAGSENSPSRLRFDFRHGSGLDASLVSDIEQRVNERLQENLHVTSEVMPIEKAKQTGAIALFGEKYGQEVRVVSIDGNWSKEFCAGTHVNDTGSIGMFTLLGESSIGSGVRRIEALVGKGAYAQGAKERAILSALTSSLGGKTEEIEEKVSTLLMRIKQAEKEIKTLQQEKILSLVDTVMESKHTVNGYEFYSFNIGDVDSADGLRLLANRVLEKMSDSSPSVLALFAVSHNRPLVFIAATSKAQENGVHAGKYVSEVAKILGGGGGGKSAMAQGGGTDSSQIPQAMKHVESLLNA
ncbi:MAG: alanine--tRNA ligase, partial [Actinomycetaceae bacterium]|nr:alanine--tRNA ligase [Actinomycetaceae bacterium]